jgi:hypothetical protein
MRVYEYSYDYENDCDDEDCLVICGDDGANYITSIPLRYRVRDALHRIRRDWLSDPLHIVRRCSVCGKLGTYPGEKECAEHMPLPF